MAEENANPGLLDIGQPPGIAEHHSTDAAYNSYIKKVMRVVDLIPLYFSLDVAKIFSKAAQEEETTFTDLIQLQYDQGIYEFNTKLAGIGHPDAGALAGVRMWVTSQSTVEESLSNSYKPNAIVSAYNGAREAIVNNPAYAMAQSVSGGKIAPPGAQGLLAGLMDAKQLSLPQIWESTDYTPSANFTVKLSSPYGDKDSYNKNIARPLLGLLSLISPSSSDGVTYGLPPFLTIKAYGSMHITLGIIDNFSINRGGPDTRFNAKKQPLEIEINMGFKQALPGFAAMIGSGDSPGDATDIAKYQDIELPYSGESSQLSGTMPGIVTLGSIIESLRPADPSTITGAGLNTSNVFGTLLGENFANIDPANLTSSVMDMIGNVGDVDVGEIFDNVGEMFDNVGETIGNLFP